MIKGTMMVQTGQEAEIKEIKTTTLKIKSNPRSNPKRYFRKTTSWFCSGPAEFILYCITLNYSRPLLGIRQFFTEVFLRYAFQILNIPRFFISKLPLLMHLK